LWGVFVIGNLAEGEEVKSPKASPISPSVVPMLTLAIMKSSLIKNLSIIVILTARGAGELYIYFAVMEIAIKAPIVWYASICNK